MKAGRASVTAQRVAAQRLTFDRVGVPYGDASADDLLARDVAGEVGDATGPLTRYLAARTSFFDRVVVGALDAGVDQVVVLAAGYDGRSLRYARDGVTWFEIDHPATQADKLERLARLGIESTAVFAAADFAIDDVGAVLAAAGQEAERPTLFLCEGVAVYLDRPVLESLLRSARARAAVGSRLAISLSVPGATASGRKWFRAAVARVGEPARDELTPEEAKPLLESCGWRPVDPSGSGERAALGGFVLAEAI